MHHSLQRLRALPVTVVFAIHLLFPRSLFAQCPIIGFDLVSVVFHGTVIDVAKPPRITFNVDRVWKGQVPRRFDLISPMGPIVVSEGLNKFEVGQSYLVLAREVYPQGRQAGRKPVIMPDLCGTHAATLEEAIRSARGEGHRPR